MKIPTRHRDCHASQGQWLRSLRGGFVVTLITIGMLLASLPGAAASSNGLPDPTSVLESSPSPSPDASPSPSPDASVSPSPDASVSPSPDASASPSPAPTEETPSPTATVEPQPTPTDAGSPSPTWSPEPSPSVPTEVGLVVNHVTAATLGLPGTSPTYLAPDVPLTNLARFQVFRLRFEIQNTDAMDAVWQPALGLVQPDGSAVPVPADGQASGEPFYAAREWVRAAAGTKIGTSSTAIPGSDGTTAGMRSMGVNPLPEMTLPAGATTVLEFSVSATADAAYLASYDFVLTDAGSELGGTARATVVMQEKPPVRLSPGQRYGIPADESVPSQSILRYALTAPDGSGPIHGSSYSLTSDTCAACHRAHTAPGSQITAAPSQLALCSTCHNGTNLPDIRTAYETAPQNDPATRSYYQHDPAVVGGALGTGNDCSDCHNPHYATSTASVAGADGWTSSGRIAAASGVAVTYDPITSQPTYTLVPRTTLEYQLCFKCHSGYAQLPSNDGQPPSHYELDAAIEFDPANGSYHPIEAPGTNDTTQMDASLAGSSPYKLWTFTSQSTIRCVNCHADASLAATGSPPLGADASLPVHASSERGILLASYQDRVLNGPIEPYQAADFALCFLCHSEAPFLDTSGDARTDTNFRYHGLHVSGSALLDHGSPGTDIDTPGDGSGLAVCAECHFRVHSTAFPVGAQAAGSRLVDFAPDVTAPTGGDLGWTPLTDGAAGTCTLKCHGQPHTATY